MRLIFEVPKVPDEKAARKLRCQLKKLEQFKFYHYKEKADHPYIWINSFKRDQDVPGELFWAYGTDDITSRMDINVTFCSGGKCWFSTEPGIVNEVGTKISWSKGVKLLLDYLMDKLEGFDEEEQRKIDYAIKQICKIQPKTPKITVKKSKPKFLS